MITPIAYALAAVLPATAGTSLPAPFELAYATDDTSRMLATASRERTGAQGLFGRVAFAYLANRGNADSTSLNGEIDLGYVAGAWRHALRLQSMRGSSDGVRNAESSRASEQSDYTFSNNNYAFGAFDTMYDRFGPYQTRTSVIAGFGRRLIDTPAHGLDIQLGVGSSWTRKPQEEAVAQEGVLATQLRYEWRINDHASFSQRINVEARSANTFSESVTALTTSIQGSLAMSLSYSIRHNTVVPPDRRKNDSATAVSLIYGF